MKRVLIVILLFVISFSLWAVDWTDVSVDRDIQGIPVYSSPISYVIPRDAAVKVDLASTNFTYSDVANINFDEGDFKAEHQIAVASIQGLRYSDISSGASVTIRVDCPQGLEFISESNPAYRRPFNIVVAVSYARVSHNGSDSTYYTMKEHRGARLSKAGEQFVLDVSQNNLPQSYASQEFWVVFDILLELQGTVENGVLTMNDGSEYTLANLNDYTAAVTVSISCESNNTADSAANVNSSLIIPFSGYYDSRGGQVEAVSSLSVSPTARASTLRLDEEQGQPIDVATVNFMRLLKTNGRLDESPSPFDTADTRIFFSSSANPEIDGGKFKFVHDAVQPGDLIDDRNSIQYEIRSVDSSGGHMVVFDGTMTRAEMEGPKESAGDYVIIPQNITSRSHPDYGRDVAYWQEYNGTIQVVLERKYNMMYAGAYKSYVYVHVYVEDGV